VLQRVCPSCAFDAETFPPQAVAAAVRSQAVTWAELLAEPMVRERPDPRTWSALEYGCHVRDVFVLFERRLQLMLTQDHPTFANWDQDQTAVTSRYDLQDPDVVVAELTAAAAGLADTFESVHGEQWSRTGERSDGAVFTVATFAQYMIHDPLHHVDDVRKGYRALAGEK
jgi:hypothetical protein